MCLSAYLHQHRRDVAQTFMVDSPDDALQLHKVSARNSPRGGVGGQKSLKNPKNPEKLSPARGRGYCGGRPLWDISTYLHQHRGDITQNFMVDSPSDDLQTQKVSGLNSSRGRVGGPDRSHARATCRPLELCARNLRITRAVHVQPGDQ